MADKSFVKQLAENINKNKTVSASKLVNSNPNLASVISKLINPRNIAERKLHSSKNLSTSLNTNKIGAISNSVSSRYKDNKNVLQLFPDLELAMQILVSSILSPKDMVKTELIYKTNDTIFPLEINAQLLELVKNYLNSNYKLTNDLSRILEDVLFYKGSYIKAILPESLLDAVINNKLRTATEGLDSLYHRTDQSTTIKRLGFIGTYSSKARVSLESYANTRITNGSSDIGLFIDEDNPKQVDKYIEVSDNIDILKLPLVRKTMRTNIINNIAKESISTTIGSIDNKLFKTIGSDTKLVEILPGSETLLRKSITKPLIMEIPSEAVIPVSLPNEPSKHLGYFIVLDEMGNPISATQDDYNRLQNTFTNKSTEDSLSSYLTQKAVGNLRSSETRDSIKLDNIMQIYTNLVEDNLKRRLVNGLYDDNLSISKDEEIYRIMLARSLSNKYTKILYIPAEFISYFAFDYYENGIGKSLLDNLKIITSIRAILLFARVMAQLKSSINITKVNLTLDEDDPDPQKTVEIAVHEVLKLRQQYLPLGINSPTDLVDWVQRAGLEFSFEGHPGLPNTKFDFNVSNLQHTMPPSDFEDDLRKQTYMALGLSPETIDSGFNPEFATTVVSNNILLSKRVMIYQDKLVVQLLDYIKKILIHDTKLRNEISDIIKGNIESMTKYVRDEDKDLFNNDKERYIDKLLNDFIDTLSINLPKPDETTIDNQISSFDKYNEAIDKVLDNWISSELTNNSLTGNISDYVDTVKPIVKSYFMRKWMSENNFMPEISELVTADDEGNPNIDLYDISKSHITSLMKSMFKLIKTMQTNKTIMDNNLEKIGAEEPEPTESSEEESESTGTDEFGEEFTETEEPISETKETESEETEEKESTLEEPDKTE